MRRHRQAKIVATIGPASHSREMIGALFQAGVDVFRLNFSHGSHEDHQRAVEIIRQLELQYEYPIGILLDLQGPKLRIGPIQENTQLQLGEKYVLDLETALGNSHRASFPHPEIFPILTPGTALLIDDGRLRLEVTAVTPHTITTKVLVGGALSSRKGVNIPALTLPISVLTAKDRKDLELGLRLGVDWIALSFVQRPEDIQEVRALVPPQIKIIAKLEKPQAIERLEEIIAAADSVMIARGDLGVEAPLEAIPSLQKRIIKACRQVGKPTVVATQMLDSMVHTPSPTRAEVSDVATAIYDGADAVMLSAESASGAYPLEAVTMMDRIIKTVENDPLYRQLMSHSNSLPLRQTPGAIMAAARQIEQVIPIAAIVVFTDSGGSAMMAARERAAAPILGLTISMLTARQLSLVWGVHAALASNLHSFDQMVAEGAKAASLHKLAQPGENIVIIAGVPFGTKGSTNVIRVIELAKDPAAS